jgi:hypothetical protein
LLMPRRAPKLECSAEDNASLVDITKSRIEEARSVGKRLINRPCVPSRRDGMLEV